MPGRVTDVRITAGDFSHGRSNGPQDDYYGEAADSQARTTGPVARGYQPAPRGKGSRAWERGLDGTKGLTKASSKREIEAIAQALASYYAPRGVTSLSVERPLRNAVGGTFYAIEVNGREVQRSDGRGPYSLRVTSTEARVGGGVNTSWVTKREVSAQLREAVEAALLR